MYIDVRGPHPVLFIGMRAFQLTGATRAITVEQAIQYLQAMGEL